MSSGSEAGLLHLIISAWIEEWKVCFHGGLLVFFYPPVPAIAVDCYRLPSPCPVHCLRLRYQVLASTSYQVLGTNYSYCHCRPIAVPWPSIAGPLFRTIAVPLPSVAARQPTAMDGNGTKENTSKVSLKIHLTGADSLRGFHSAWKLPRLAPSHALLFGNSDLERPAVGGLE